MATIAIESVPDRIDVRVLAGRPFGLTVPILDAAGAAVAVAAVTSARAQVRQQVGDAQVLYTFSTADEGADIVDDGGDALIHLTATSERTTQWQLLWPGEAPETVVWWDLEITDDDDVPHQVTAPGTITLVHQVTR